MKLATALLTTALALWFAGAQAQGYPAKPIRLVVPFAAGGSGDVVGRTVGAKLTEAWGQQVLIDNRPGAAGAIGTSSVAGAPADGYTLLLADDSPLSITPHIHKAATYTVGKDLAPIVAIAQIEFVLTVHPSMESRTLPELVTLLKGNPGKYSYASAGIGSIHHLSMEWFKRVAGVDIVHVPYKGSGQILPDIMSGQVNITYTGLAQTLPYVTAGKLRALAIGGPQRVAAAPNLPPIAEFYPGFNGTTSWNLLAPAGTPPEILQKLNAEVNRILKLPEVADALTSRGLFPVGGTQAEFAAKLKSDYERWGQLVREVGLRAE